MALHTKKLYYHRAGATYSVNLYTLTTDVGADYLALCDSGTTVYIPTGLVEDANSSHLRVRNSTEIKAILTTALPAGPTGLTTYATASQADYATVTWNAVTGATAYRVYLNGTPLFYTTKLFTTISPAPTDMIRNPGASRSIQVSAMVGGVESAKSAAYMYTAPDLVDPTLMGQKLFWHAATSTSISLAWIKNAAADEYLVTVGATQITVPVSDLRCTVTGLSPNTVYTCIVEPMLYGSVLETYTQISAQTLTDANKLICYGFTPEAYRFVVPTGVTQLNFKMWGSGGGSQGGSTGNFTGGYGGYTTATGLAVSPGTVFVAACGSIRVNSTVSTKGHSYGGGGYGSTNGTVVTGGGRTALWKADGTLFAVAAGGGCSGQNRNGGSGGGLTGEDAPGGVTAGSGGGATQSAPGVAGSSAYNGVRPAAGFDCLGGYGGVGAERGGGGGGGYYGGGGGYVDWAGWGRGGGGGSGYLKAGLTGETKIHDATTDADTDRTITSKSMSCGNPGVGNPGFGIPGCCVFWW